MKPYRLHSRSYYSEGTFVLERKYKFKGLGTLRFELISSALIVHPIPVCYKPSIIKALRKYMFEIGTAILNEFDYTTVLFYTSNEKLVKLFCTVPYTIMGKDNDKFIYAILKEDIPCPQSQVL